MLCADKFSPTPAYYHWVANANPLLKIRKPNHDGTVVPVRWVLRDDFNGVRGRGVRSSVRCRNQVSRGWGGSAQKAYICVSLAQYWGPQVRAILRRRPFSYLLIRGFLPPSTTEQTFVSKNHSKTRTRGARGIFRDPTDTSAPSATGLVGPLGWSSFERADFRACWHLWQQYGSTLGNLDIGRRVRAPNRSAGHPLHSPHAIIASSYSALLGLQMNNRLCICSLQVDITALVPFFQCLSHLRLIIGVRLEYYDEAAGKNF